MSDGKGTLILSWNSDKGPSATEVLRVIVVLRPAAREDLNPLRRDGGADNVVEGAIGQTLEWRGIRLERDRLVRERSGEDAGRDDDVEWLLRRERQGRC